MGQWDRDIHSILTVIVTHSYGDGNIALTKQSLDNHMGLELPEKWKHCQNQRIILIKLLHTAISNPHLSTKFNNPAPGKILKIKSNEPCYICLLTALESGPMCAKLYTDMSPLRIAWRAWRALAEPGCVTL